jgi:hypothetical protein
MFTPIIHVHLLPSIFLLPSSLITHHSVGAPGGRLMDSSLFHSLARLITLSSVPHYLLIFLEMMSWESYIWVHGMSI